MRILRATALLSVGRSASLAIAVCNSILIASRFGGGPIADAFFVVQVFPVVLAVAIRSTLNVSVIPAFEQKRVEQSEDEAWKLVGATFIRLSVLYALVALALFVFARQASAILAPGFPPESRDLLCHLVRLTSGIFFLTSLGASLECMFNAHKRFAPPVIGHLMVPAGILAGLLFWAERWGIDGVIAGLALGAAAQLIVVGISGMTYWPRRLGTAIKGGLRAGDSAREVWRLAFPAFFSNLIVHVNAVVLNMIATTLGAGKVAAIRYAASVVMIGPPLVVSALMTAAFPTMVEKLVRKELKEFRSLYLRCSRAVVFVALSLAVGMAIQAEALTRLIFERGAFGPEMTALVTPAVALYGIQIIFSSLNVVTKTTLYSLRRNTFLLFIGALNIIGTAGVGLLLSRSFDYMGLIYSQVLISAIQIVIFAVALKPKIEKPITAILGFRFKTLVAALIAGVVMVIVRHFIPSLPESTLMMKAAAAIVPAVAGIAALLLASLLLRVEETTLALRALMRRPVYGRGGPGRDGSSQPDDSSNAGGI